VVSAEVQSVILSYLLPMDSTKTCRNGMMHATQYILRYVYRSELFDTHWYCTVYPICLVGEPT